MEGGRARLLQLPAAKSVQPGLGLLPRGFRAARGDVWQSSTVELGFGRAALGTAASVSAISILLLSLSCFLPDIDFHQTVNAIPGLPAITILIAPSVCPGLYTLNGTLVLRTL